MNKVDLKQFIQRCLLEHSTSMQLQSSIIEEPDEEDWLWCGEFDKVADEIIKYIEDENL